MNLVFENLSKDFGDKVAVNIPSLTIYGGEFFTFVGPSGCGKSTTLNLIAGLEEPTGGRLALGDQYLHDLPPHHRNVAFVFQSYALYPHRTVFRNLAFPLELARMPRTEIQTRVEEAAALLGLRELLGKYPRQLSGGERQRVALGRAIVRQPKLFLLDEPLSNLDAPLRAQMRKELKRIHRRLGTTFLYVTHDQEEALSLSDRIAVMRAGRIEQCGTPAEVYEQPINTFVARFFGNPPMNLLDAEGQPDGSLRIGEQTIAPGVSLRSGPVSAGIRPEHVRLGRHPLPGSWAMDVAIVELHGSQSYIELQGQGFALTAVRAAEEGFCPGDRLWVTVPSKRVYLFDVETGARVKTA